MIYLLDTNVVSDWINGYLPVITMAGEKIRQQNWLMLAQPIHYEVRRGLLAKGQTRKLSILQNEVVPRLHLVSLVEEDWLRAAELWAAVRLRGIAISDVDIFLAVLALRLDATIVTSDNDFDPLPVRRENWREASP